MAETQDPFENIAYLDPAIPPTTADEVRAYANQFFNTLEELNVGQGVKSLKVDRSGIWLGANLFSAAPFSVDMLGNVIANSILINGLGGDIIAGSIDGDGNFINELISVNLNTQSKEILGSFEFVGSGALDISTDANNGLWISPTGILGKKSGATTFAIENDGDATFGGTLVAASGTFGTITAGTITGVSIKATSSTTGANVFLDPTNKRISFLYDNSEKAYIYVDSSGNMILDADNLIYLIADGAGDDVVLQAADTVFLDGGSVYINATSDFVVSESDNAYTFFNSDSDSSDCAWIDDGAGDTLMVLDSSDENLYIDGSFIDTGADFAEFFEATPQFASEKIPVGTSVVLEGDKIRPAIGNEKPFGVISANPTIVGNSGGTSSGQQWGGKYLKDDFGQYIMEEAEFWSKKVTEETTKENGKVRKLNKRVHGYSDVKKPPRGAKVKTVMRKKLNPDWDGKKEYVPRSQRPEWNIVGLIGRLRVRVGQPVAPHWVKLRSVSPEVDEYLIR